MDPDEWAQCGISRDHCVDKAKKILFDFLRNVDLAKKDVDWKNDPYGTNVRMVADYLSRREDIPDDLQQKIEEIFDKS
jgi:hypothetical protein